MHSNLFNKQANAICFQNSVNRVVTVFRVKIFVKTKFRRDDRVFLFTSSSNERTKQSYWICSWFIITLSK